MADIKNFMVGEDQKTIDQINEIANSMAYKDSKIRIMADAHCGKGAVVGSTITYKNKICPNTVGVDIACRVSAYETPYKEIPAKEELMKLDSVISNFIPTGFKCRSEESWLSKDFPYESLSCWKHLNGYEHLRKSMGSLGGGNHYIELDYDDNGVYLLIHSGSRNLGKQVCEYYQKKAIEHVEELRQDIIDVANAKAKFYARMNSFANVKKAIAERDEQIAALPNKDLAFIEGQDLLDYIHDIEIVQVWSELNHCVMYEEIATEMGWKPQYDNYITCIHNYVDTGQKIIRKGAIDASTGKLGLVPLNMRDGVLIVRGKGNDDYNCSAPHGAGRLMSRTKARSELSLEDFQKSMEEIYSTSVLESTIDEAPAAYKDANDIIAAISDTVEIVKHLKPLYNFKDKSK
jgi:tRNA-splicing ligase RtcB